MESLCSCAVQVLAHMRKQQPRWSSVDVNKMRAAIMVLAMALLALAPCLEQAEAKGLRAHILQDAATFAAAGDAPVQLAQSEGEATVSASEAASIARDSVPGSKVLKVELLPSGVYAVTLKDGGNVTRVMVDATTGSIV